MISQEINTFTQIWILAARLFVKISEIQQVFLTVQEFLTATLDIYR